MCEQMREADAARQLFSPTKQQEEYDLNDPRGGFQPCAGPQAGNLRSFNAQPLHHFRL